MFKLNTIEPLEKKVWLSSPTIYPESMEYVMEAYETNWMSTIGANINVIENIIREKIGSKHAVALSTGTAALHMAIKLAGERVYGKRDAKEGTLCGKYVAVSDMTFAATVNPIVYEGGIPVFIDTEYDTWNMDPEALKKAFELYPQIKIVVVAHLYGTPSKIDEIRKICDQHGAIMVEDAAESFGATYKGAQTGTFGEFSIISFNGNKIITGSSGGMLLTDDREATEQVRKWSTQSRENVDWYQHEEIGYNYRMSNVIAGVVRGQVPYLEKHIAQKKAIYMRYKEGLKDLPVKMNPYDKKICQPNYWLSCIIIDEDYMCRQSGTEEGRTYISEQGKSCPTEILEAISSINAQGRPIWKPMHMQPIYKNCQFVSANDDAGADIFARGLCLPSDNKMTVEEQDKVIEAIRACFE